MRSEGRGGGWGAGACRGGEGGQGRTLEKQPLALGQLLFPCYKKKGRPPQWGSLCLEEIWLAAFPRPRNPRQNRAVLLQSSSCLCPIGNQRLCYPFACYRDKIPATSGQGSRLNVRAAVTRERRSLAWLSSLSSQNMVSLNQQFLLWCNFHKNGLA